MLPQQSAPTEDRVNIGYRGTEDYRRNLQIEALKRGVKVQNLLDAAVAFYLEHNPSLQETSVAPKG